MLCSGVSSRVAVHISLRVPPVCRGQQDCVGEDLVAPFLLAQFMLPLQ